MQANERNTPAVEDYGNDVGLANEVHDEPVPEPEYASDQEAITDINQLDMQTEPLEDVDMEKLEEQLSYAPSLTPGKFFDFRFKLAKGKPNSREGAWQQGTKGGQTIVAYNYEAILQKEDGTEGKTLRFQRADTFKAGKMTASRAQELLFALGKLPKFQQTKKQFGDILALLEEASEEGVVFSGQVKWRHYDKATGITTSTHPDKPYTKKNQDGSETRVEEQPWPRDAQGKYERHPGNEEIMRVAPTKETLERMRQESGKGTSA